MANQHSDANQGVHYRIPRDLVVRLKEEVARTGEHERVFVATAIENELARRADLHERDGRR